MEQEYFEEDEEMFVTITLEDDSEIECRVLTIFETDDQDYIALMTVKDEDDDSWDGDILIYRYFEDENGEAGLDNIESEEEFEMVSEIFDQIMEDEEDEEDEE